MSRRNFLLKFFLWLLSFVLGYKVGEVNSTIIIDKDGSVVSEKITAVNQQLTDNVTDLTERGLNLKKFDHLKVEIEGGYDWSNALSSALSKSKNIYAPEGTYYISNIELPSGCSITGVQGKTIFRGIKKADVGQYVGTIFMTKSKQNLQFEGITFDGGVISNKYVVTKDRSKVTNLLTFKDSQNIRFEKCKFTRFITNVLDASVCTPEDLVIAWNICTFNSCDAVTLKNCSLTDSYLEGIVAYKSTNVEIENFKSKNTYLSTPLAAWYCDGVKLLKLDLNEDIGRPNGESSSILNMYSKNVEIKSSTFTGGTAIDLGNEAEDTTIGFFIQENVTIKDCKIKGCINSIGVNKAHQLNRNITISNCVIDARGFQRGINTGNSEDILIEGTEIVGAENGVRYSSNKVINFKMTKCKIRDCLKTVVFVINGKDCKGVDIYNNEVITKNITDAGGNGGFVIFLNSADTTGFEKVIDINVYKNRTKCAGSWVYVYQMGPNVFRIKNMNVEDNEFDALDGGTCDRSLSLHYIDELSVKRNKMRNVSTRGNVFAYITDIELEGNKAYLVNAPSIAKVYDIRNTVTGTVKANDNEIKTGTAIHHFKGEIGLILTNVKTKQNVPDTYTGDFKPSHFGPTANRPVGIKNIGDGYFDITLNKQLYWNGTAFVDSTGDIV